MLTEISIELMTPDIGSLLLRDTYELGAARLGLWRKDVVDEPTTVDSTEEDFVKVEEKYMDDARDDVPRTLLSSMLTETVLAGRWVLCRLVLWLADDQAGFVVLLPSPRELEMLLVITVPVLIDVCRGVLALKVSLILLTMLLVLTMSALIYECIGVLALCISLLLLLLLSKPVVWLPGNHT